MNLEKKTYNLAGPAMLLFFGKSCSSSFFPINLFTSLIFMSSLFVTVRNLLVGSSHFLIEKLYLPIDHGEC